MVRLKAACATAFGYAPDTAQEWIGQVEESLSFVDLYDNPLPTVDAELTLLMRNDIGPKLEPQSYSKELQKEWDYKTEEMQMEKKNIRRRQLL